MLASALMDGPQTLEELEDTYGIMGRRFGIYFDLMDPHSRPTAPSADPKATSSLRQNMERSLDILVRRGWATESDGLYHLTEEGRREAHIMLDELEKSGRLFKKAIEPETVTTVTLVVHFLLAAIKFPAALMSGSVGLLNDALDTLMDGFSSLFVVLGVRSGHERAVSYLLLLFMIGTGGFTLYEAITRFVDPQPLTQDWTAFVAVTLSAGLCALLWLYQKYAGLKHRCVPLIAQSIDSRNHIIVAAGVTTGLVAAIFHITLIDPLVGVTVAVLILKGAVQLLIDLVRSGNDQEMELSKYGFTRLERHQHRQRIRWLLYEIDTGSIQTRKDLYDTARDAVAFSPFSSLRALGWNRQDDHKQKIDRAIRDLFQEGLVVEDDQTSAVEESDSSYLTLSPAGEDELERALSTLWRHVSTSSDRGHARPLIVLSRVVQFLFSAVGFSILIITGRWLLNLLPAWDVWGPDPSLECLLPNVAAPLWSSPLLTLGPVALTGGQLGCVLAGLILFHLGYMLVHRSRPMLRHSRTPDRRTPAFLLTDGPYAQRRHPLATGIILLNAGLGIGLYSAWSLGWALLAGCLQICQSIREEKYLDTRWGREFLDYRHNVPHRFLSVQSWIFFGTLYFLAWAGM